MKTRQTSTVDSEYRFTLQEQLTTLLHSMKTIGKVEVVHVAAQGHDCPVSKPRSEMDAVKVFGV
jgi:hypothetical protein